MAFALTTVAPVCHADVSVEVEVSFFHGRLAPHGD
jgi:hypothetical protein